MIEVWAVGALWVVIIAGLIAVFREEFTDRRREDEFIRQMAAQRRRIERQYGSRRSGVEDVDIQHRPRQRRAA